jgi:hypothetical protein
MTAQATEATPAPQPAAVQASNAAQALRAVEVLALERAAVRAVTAPLRARLVAVQRAAVRAWIAAFGSLDTPGDPVRSADVAAQVRGDLSRIRVDASTVLHGYMQRALDLGVRQGAHTAGVSPAARDIAATVNTSTARTVAGLDQAIAAGITAADAAVGRVSGGTFTDLNEALAEAHRAVPRAAAATVTAVHGAANAGKAAVADAFGAGLLWLVEPDCCTSCAGFAGRIAPAGQPFDTKLAYTFTDKPRIWPPGPVEHPGLHPSCRCECVPYLGVEAGASGPSLPAVLQREARRAILKGWSLPSESGAERIRAARKALARNPVAPKSVKAYSRRAVAAGRFPDRNVPHHITRPWAATTSPRRQGRSKEGTQ